VDDIRRHDQKLFTQELLRPGRCTLSLAFIIFGSWMFFTVSPVVGALILAAVSGLHVYRAYNDAVSRRWLHQRFKALWASCEDRLTRFNEVLEKMRRDQIADLQEMPRTIHGVGDSLYLALRRADQISHDVLQTEKGILHAPPAWHAMSEDAQARELYRIADKNIAEYRQFYGGVMAGVQRAEAQAAVFMTTLDSLRMKMIGHRLVGKQPDMASHEFLTALSEAKLQLEAIDQALDELDFSQMPKMIAAMPPPFDPANIASNAAPPVEELRQE
jgi:hypothetical protein